MAPVPEVGNSIFISEGPDSWWTVPADGAGITPVFRRGLTPGGWEPSTAVEGGGMPPAIKGKGPGNVAGYGIAGSLCIPPICMGCSQNPWEGAATADKEGWGACTCAGTDGIDATFPAGIPGLMMVEEEFAAMDGNEKLDDNGADCTIPGVPGALGAPGFKKGRPVFAHEVDRPELGVEVIVVKLEVCATTEMDGEVVVADEAMPVSGAIPPETFCNKKSTRFWIQPIVVSVYFHSPKAST